MALWLKQFGLIIKLCCLRVVAVGLPTILELLSRVCTHRSAIRSCRCWPRWTALMLELVSAPKEAPKKVLSRVRLHRSVVRSCRLSPKLLLLMQLVLRRKTLVVVGGREPETTFTPSASNCAQFCRNSLIVVFPFVFTL